jgi:hypothetical protein
MAMAQGLVGDDKIWVHSRDPVLAVDYRAEAFQLVLSAKILAPLLAECD